jgi:type 1 fimbria pilin
MTTHRLSNSFLSPTVRRIRGLAFATLALIVGFALPTGASAQSGQTGCFKINGLTTDRNSPYYTDPGTAARLWLGAANVAGSDAYPMTVQITNFSPNGTLIGSGVASINDMGYRGVGSYYSPEQVLFRCSPDSGGTMFEYFSTNGDNVTAGGTDISSKTGIDGTYTFPAPNIASRVTNLTANATVTRHWKALPFVNLDRDSQNWYLVKAKNFSRYKVDLYQCKNCGAYASNGQPIAYVAFKGGKSGNLINAGLYEGADHATNYTGWYEMWPGAINPKPSLIVRSNQTTCTVENTTPFVLFPTVSVAELERGGSRQVPITINIKCEKSFSAAWSGNRAQQTAMGIQINPANAQSAVNAGLKSAGTGVRYLLSNDYGVKSSVATGVGVTLSRPDGRAVNFLTNRYTTMGGSNDGWEPALDDAVQSGQDDNWVHYTRTINATFRAFAPGATRVTPGSYNATAEAVIQIQ